MKKLKLLVVAGILFVTAFSLVSLFHAYSFTHPVSGDSIGLRPVSMDVSAKERVSAVLLGVRPIKGAGSVTPSDHALDYEPVSFRSRDNLTLDGWLVKANNPQGIVILAHGYSSNKESMLNLSKVLYDSNYSSLLFDFRGSGTSEGDYVSLGYYERLDLLGAIDHIRTRSDLGSERIFGIGRSMGGAAMVLAAAETDDFRGIVLESTYATLHQNVARRFQKVYGLPKFPFATSLIFFGGVILGVNAFDIAPVNTLEQVHTPVLIIQGTEDDNVFVEDAKTLFNHANEPKVLWVVEGAGHAEAYAKEPQAYERKVTAFLKEYGAPDTNQGKTAGKTR